MPVHPVDEGLPGARESSRGGGLVNAVQLGEARRAQSEDEVLAQEPFLGRVEIVDGTMKGSLRRTAVVLPQITKLGVALLVEPLEHCGVGRRVLEASPPSKPIEGNSRRHGAGPARKTPAPLVLANSGRAALATHEQSLVQVRSDVAQCVALALETAEGGIDLRAAPHLEGLRGPLGSLGRSHGQVEVRDRQPIEIIGLFAARGELAHELFGLDPQVRPRVVTGIQRAAYGLSGRVGTVGGFVVGFVPPPQQVSVTDGWERAGHGPAGRDGLTSVRCPSEQAIVDLIDGRLDEAECVAITSHLEGCDACQAVAADLAAISATHDGAPPHDGAADDAADTWGVDTERYVLQQRLGRGGMGIVYAAHDRRLDRRVALKLLRFDVGPNAVEPAPARMLLEAKALAKVSHPNVVTVYDVGLLPSGSVFLSMELIDGSDLSQWLSAERTWQQILAMFAAAGRGLTAAHAHGLVHRDFKPANVLVGSDGAVRVTDFGLARVVDSDDACVQTAGTSVVEVEGALTEVGTVVGTPAYMSPEQRRGGQVDPRSDQFSFCVALYEAIYKVRPYAGTCCVDLLHAVSQGAIRRPESGPGGPPRALFRVLARGLAFEPGDRHASMDALLERLERILEPSRAVRHALGVVGMLGLAGIVLTHEGRPRMCHDLDEPMAALYDDAKREQLGDRFGALSTVGTQAWERVAPQLDAWTGAWVEARRDACEATHVRGEQSEARLDRRMECLDQRLAELDALLGILGSPTQETARYAVRAVGALGAIESCADPSAVNPALVLPSDPELAAEVEEVRKSLVRIRAVLSAGQYLEAVEDAAATDAVAQTTEHGPVMAEARAALGKALFDAGRLDEAESTLDEALALALAAKHDAVFASVAGMLVRIASEQPDRGDDLERLVRQAEAALTRIGNPAGHRRPLLQGQLQWAQSHARYEEADRIVDTMAALRDAAGAPVFSRAEVLNSRGDLRRAQGKNAEAVDLLREALAARTETLGDRHPEVGRDLNNLAIALRDEDGEEALELFLRALELEEAGMGSENLEVARLHNNIGMTLSTLGRYDEVPTHLARAIELKAQVMGPDSPTLATSYANLAVFERRRGKLDRAEELFTRALQLAVAGYGTTHPHVGAINTNLVKIAIARGDLAAAAKSLEAAEVVEKALGERTPTAWPIALARVEVLLADGRSERALENATRHRDIVQASADATDADRMLADASHGRALLAAAALK